MKLETRHKVKRVKRYNGEMDTVQKNKVDSVMLASDNVLAQKIYAYNKKMDELINSTNVSNSKGRSL